MNKIIGIFQEIDGDEIENFDIMKKRLNLITPTSKDIGNVKLYYNDKGIAYIIVHESEKYYGDRCNSNTYRFLNTKTNEFAQQKNVNDMVKMLLYKYCECESGGHHTLDKKDNIIKCVNCCKLNNFEDLSLNNKLNIIKHYSYKIFHEEYSTI